MRNGIDVSKWQGTIYWQDVKNSGISCAILKCGGSDGSKTNPFYRDGTFERNFSEAKKYGVEVGAYYYVGENCKSYEDGAADARRCLEIIKGKQFELPIYIDFEEPDTSNKKGNTDACIGFCETIEKAGYFAGIYASSVLGFKNSLEADRLKQFSWWVAQWGTKPAMVGCPMHVWQKSSTGKINGITGNVDLDEVYLDFAAIVKSKGLNGYTKANNNPTPRTLEQRVTALEERVRKLERG